MKLLLRTTILFMFLSCANKKVIKYSAFNDLVIGSQTINLFTNNKFEIELGLGYETGTYFIIKDTVYLTYSDSSIKNAKILIEDKYLIFLDDTEKIKFQRTDNK